MAALVEHCTTGFSAEKCSNGPSNSYYTKDCFREPSVLPKANMDESIALGCRPTTIAEKSTVAAGTTVVQKQTAAAENGH